MPVFSLLVRLKHDERLKYGEDSFGLSFIAPPITPMVRPLAGASLFTISVNLASIIKFKYRFSLTVIERSGSCALENFVSNEAGPSRN